MLSTQLGSTRRLSRKPRWRAGTARKRASTNSRVPRGTPRSATGGGLVTNLNHHCGQPGFQPCDTRRQRSGWEYTRCGAGRTVVTQYIEIDGNILANRLEQVWNAAWAACCTVARKLPFPECPSLRSNIVLRAIRSLPHGAAPGPRIEWAVCGPSVRTHQVAPRVPEVTKTRVAELEYA